MAGESSGTAEFLEAAPLEAPRPIIRNFSHFLRSMLGLAPPSGRNDLLNPAQEPGRSVAFLCFYVSGKFVGSATGFFIKPDLLVTAAHNILMAKPTAVGAFPGYDAKRNPVQSVSARKWAWDTARDLAVLVTTPSAASGLQLGGQALTSVTLAGYSTGYFGELTDGTGPAQLTGNKLEYNLTAGKGDSGGPVFFGSQPGATVVGLHTDSFDASHPYPAGGEFADQQMIARISALEAQARS